MFTSTFIGEFVEGKFGFFLHQIFLTQEKAGWACPDLNWGSSPCEGDVMTELDHTPFFIVCFGLSVV